MRRLPSKVPLSQLADVIWRAWRRRGLFCCGRVALFSASVFVVSALRVFTNALLWSVVCNRVLRFRLPGRRFPHLARQRLVLGWSVCRSFRLLSSDPLDLVGDQLGQSLLHRLELRLERVQPLQNVRLRNRAHTGLPLLCLPFQS